jgi:pimeloyl-ACP methyl ester carboxylesterase
MTEHVILLHGIWMRAFSLISLAQRLRAAGYSVETLDDASVFGGVQHAAARLRERMRGATADTVHLVGHSLGGIVALEATRGAHGLPRGHTVCLGSPLRGSAVARALAAVPGGHWMLGRSAGALIDGFDAWTDVRRVGVVAGHLPLGFGAAIGVLASPHDGTVSVAETRLPGIADHRTLAISHTGLLFSAQAAELTINFLRTGCFAAEAHGA